MFSPVKVTILTSATLAVIPGVRFYATQPWLFKMYGLQKLCPEKKEQEISPRIKFAYFKCLGVHPGRRLFEDQI